MARILVVDAESPVRALTRRILVMERHDVVDVGSAKDALAALDATAFDLVVLDVDLPDADGHDLLESIRARPEALHVPIIVTTARDDPEGILREARAGVSDRLSKPIGYAQLVSAVQQVMATDPGTLDGIRIMRSDAAELYRTTLDLTKQARERT